ncbi:MAG: gliding motility lipoprotein GldH [Bacteroidota bacterium]
MRIALFYIALAGLLLTACGPSYVFEERLEVADVGWAYADSLVTEFTVTDTVSLHNLHLTVDHTDGFPYQNFYVLIHTTFPDGQRRSEQVSLELAGKGGVWLGDCSGAECHLSIPIQKEVFFAQTGPYRVVIQQHSRRNPLPEVRSVGLALEQTAAKR